MGSLKLAGWDKNFSAGEKDFLAGGEARGWIFFMEFFSGGWKGGYLEKMCNFVG